MQVRTAELDASIFSNVAMLEDPSHCTQGVHGRCAEELLGLDVIDLSSNRGEVVCGCELLQAHRPT